MTDIFEFWKSVDSKTKIHPADEEVLSKAQHSLNLDCLPTPFYGPLKTAPIVLLYLNPGLSPKDIERADNSEEQEFYWRQRQGSEPLRSQVGLATKSWWVSRVKRIDRDPEKLREKLAVLEICPYHSATFNDAFLIPRLPSCQVALNWAREVLFYEARLEKRVVICLRAANAGVWRLAHVMDFFS
ncbi:MAG TPA: hypothetical protein VGC86_15690, partial [Afipia sp.]